MIRWSASNNIWDRRKNIGEVETPVHKPVIGASTMLPHATTFADLESDVGTLLVRRSFNTGFTNNFMNSYAAIDVAAGRWSVYSFKMSPSAIAAGTNDATLNSFLGTIPQGHKTTIVLWHEPEDNIANGEFTLTQWQQAQVHLADLIHATGRPELSIGICIMNYTFKPSARRNPDDYWPSSFNGKIDYIGIDAYNTYLPGIAGWTEWSVDAARLTPWFAGKTGQPMLMEYGCCDDPDDRSKKVKWLNDVYTWAKNTNVAALCYFNNEGNNEAPGRFINSSPQSIAAFSSHNADSKI